MDIVAKLQAENEALKSQIAIKEERIVSQDEMILSLEKLNFGI